MNNLRKINNLQLKKNCTINKSHFETLYLNNHLKGNHFEIIL